MADPLEDFLTRTKGAPAGDALGDFLRRSKGVAPAAAGGSAEDVGSYDPVAGADIPPASTSSDLPSLQDVRSGIQGVEGRVLDRLRPGPDATVPEQVARTIGAIGVHGLSSLAQLPVNAAIGLTQQGPQLDGQGRLTVPGLAGSHTEGLGLAPESQVVSGLAANPLRFGGSAIQLQAPNLLEAPASLPLEGNILSSDARQKLVAPPGGDAVSVSVPTAEAAAPKTAAEAIAIAENLYKQNEAMGNRMMPGEFANATLADIKNALPKEPMEQALSKGSPVQQLHDDLSHLQDQPTSLMDAQKAYSLIGERATAEFKANGNSAAYRDLTQIQNNMRDRIAPPDLAGTDPWTLARKAWSQAMKMQDIEAIAERANGTLNPATSFGTQINNLLNNKARIRGFSPDEIDALKAARDGGSMGDLLRTFGSRLLPLAAASVEGGTGGMLAGMGAGLIAHAGSSFMRRAATNAANRRMNNVLGTLGGNVPRDPLLPPPAVVPGNSLAAPLIPGVVNDLAAQYRNQ